MDRLQDAMRGAMCKPSILTPNDRLKTAKEIADHYNLTDPWEYAQLGVLLCRLAESGQLKRKKTRRFRKGRGRCYHPFGYNLEEFDALLGGRDIRDVLRELVPKFARGDFPIVLLQGRLRFQHEVAEAGASTDANHATIPESAPSTSSAGGPTP